MSFTSKDSVDLLRKIETEYLVRLEAPFLTDFITLTQDLALDLKAEAEDDAGIEESEKCVDIVRDLLKLKETIREERHTYRSIYQEAASENLEAGQILDLLRKGTKLERFESTELSRASIEALTKFKRELWSTNNPNGPAAAAYEPDSEDEKGMGDDDDIVMEAESIKVNCPITLKPLDDPYVNPACGHYYSLDAINNWKTGTRAQHCLIAGCTAALANYRPAPDIKRKILRARCLQERSNSVNVSSTQYETV